MAIEYKVDKLASDEFLLYDVLTLSIKISTLKIIRYQ